MKTLIPREESISNSFKSSWINILGGCTYTNHEKRSREYIGEAVHHPRNGSSASAERLSSTLFCVILSVRTQYLSEHPYAFGRQITYTIPDYQYRCEESHIATTRWAKRLTSSSFTDHFFNPSISAKLEVRIRRLHISQDINKISIR